jgi:hypothetical protein
MRREQPDDSIYVDANGCPAEHVVLDGQDVIVHYDDIPDSDITTVHGLRCTTPLRTVIDIAPETSAAEPDMLSRPGARLLRQVLVR